MSARIDPIGVAAGLSAAVHLAAAAALPGLLDAWRTPPPPSQAPVEVELVTPPVLRTAVGPVVADEPPARPARPHPPRRRPALPDPLPLAAPQAPATPSQAPRAMAALPAPRLPQAAAVPPAPMADDLLAPPAPPPSLLDVPIGTPAPSSRSQGAPSEAAWAAMPTPGGLGAPAAGAPAQVARWSGADTLLAPPAPRDGGGGSGTALPFARPAGGYQVKPCYPRSARRAGIEGTVLVKAHLTERGTVDQVEVARSIGHAETDRCATDGVRKWRFEPARRGGDAVSVWVLVPVEYRLR